MIVATALTCLALNIFNEARSEPIMGQYAVALVTINRAESRAGRGVCEETFKPKQFSWTTGVKATAQGWHIPKAMRPDLHNPIEAHAWWKAQVIARTALAGRMPDFTQGALHYHATYVKPTWARAMQPVRRIGKHIFYVSRRE